MLNWQDESPAVYYNIVILPQILVSYTLPPLVIYINMHSLWIMHKPCLPPPPPPHRAFNPHSALVSTPIWLALPCFHYSQFLGTQTRWKRVTRMDSILSCVCLWKIFIFFSRQLVLQRFACDYCFWLLFFFLRKNTFQNVWIYRTAITIRYFMYLFFVFKACYKNHFLFA